MLIQHILLVCKIKVIEMLERILYSYKLYVYQFYMYCHTYLFYRYTNIQAFGKLVVETNDLAGQRELIAEYLQNEVFKPLNELAKNTFTERKKMMSEGLELQRKLKESMDQLENVNAYAYVHISVKMYIQTCMYIYIYI